MKSANLFPARPVGVTPAGQDAPDDSVLRVLRVLGGPRAGASLALEPSGTARLSTSFGADIVLRDAGTAFSAQLVSAVGRPVRLMVERGEAEMLGMTVAAGQGCIWPTYTPLKIGVHVLAYGGDDAGRWADAEALVRSLAAEQQEAAAAAADPAPASDSGAGGHDRGAGRLAAVVARVPAAARRPLCGGIAIAAMLAAVASAPVPNFPDFGSSRERAVHILSEQGLSELAVEQTADGLLRISGTVPDQAAVARAVAGLEQAGIAHALDIDNSEDLAEAAGEVARIQGIAATARASGTRDVVLTIAAVDPDRRARLIRAIRADVPEIARLVVEDGLDTADTTAPRTVSEAAKRVATVVAGDPGYVLTADGGRYFPGATMPSGHVLQAVEDGAILVARNGTTTRIRF